MKVAPPGYYTREEKLEFLERYDMYVEQQRLMNSSHILSLAELMERSNKPVPAELEFYGFRMVEAMDGNHLPSSNRDGRHTVMHHMSYDMSCHDENVELKKEIEKLKSGSVEPTDEAIKRVKKTSTQRKLLIKRKKK